MSLVTPLLIALASGGITFIAMRAALRRRANEIVDSATTTAAATIRSGELEAAAIRRSRETEARKQALDERARADHELTVLAEELSRATERLGNRESELEDELTQLGNRAEELEQRQRDVASMRDRARGLRNDATDRRQRAQLELEQKAGETADEIRDSMMQGWIEQARIDAHQRVRQAEQVVVASPEHEREGKRLMDIACSRYQNHFLTERTISTLRVGPDVCELLLADGGSLHEALQEVANVQMHINDDHDSVRLEGLDGVGREVARRALNRLMKRTRAKGSAKSDPRAFAERIRASLEREIVSLGQKAFSVLSIPRPHPEIVALVGALNFRTSYTQNQWLHAVEASFLSGMIAAEMGLDVKLARRATLMHDIGKALTHKIEGSHAVIGADIARRLGEDEIVANAIGAHHADEPPNSTYAYLVAAADAMSGARPGARREATDGFSARVEDLERIGTSYRGVEQAHAVHGGRELRVYVKESAVSDLEVVELSGEIAQRISDEMTFPGQIKVTIIRSFEAVSTAR